MAGRSATPNAGTPTEGVAARRSGRWRLRNWRLRTKVLAVLIIPMLTALVLAGLRAQSELSSQQELQLTVSQLEVAGKAATVANQLERERLIAVGQVAGAEDTEGPSFAQQTKQVDKAIDDLRQANDSLTEEDPGLGRGYAGSLQRLDSLDAVRSTVRGNSAYPATAVYDVYTSVLNDLVQLGREVNAAVTDRDLLRESSVVQSLSEAKEYASAVDASLLIGAGSDEFPTGVAVIIRSAQASFEGAKTAFDANATTDEQQFYSDTVTGPEIDDRERVREIAFTRDELGEALSLRAANIVEDSQATSERLRTVETSLQDQLRDRASALADEAEQSALRDGAIVLAALLAALLLVVLVVRSLLKPLRILRTSALDVAYRKLPDEVDQILADPNPMEASKNAVQPVPVFTADETGQVARSFDEVHTRAVQLAAEQALLRDNVNAMLVNLSRRSQALVERQLGLIDRLEADEQDPDQLSNLFELDHLATRMRRNSENLLVLSGTELGRRLSKPVPISDVIGAAVSETDQYARVDVRPAPQAALVGPAVNDVVHLIAELLDNATAYSAPDTQVTVRSATGRKGTLAVEVIDRGVGVDEVELARLNERLANPPDLDVSVSRRMGLYVVATLARRHAIQVQLRENLEIEGGVVAKVVLPAALVSELAGGPQTGIESTGPSTGTFGGGPSTSGTFPPVGADEQGLSSPAMASNGIAGAFGVSTNGHGRSSSTNGYDSGYRPSETPQPPQADVPAEATAFMPAEQPPAQNGSQPSTTQSSQASRPVQPPQSELPTRSTPPEADDRSAEQRMSLNGDNTRASDLDVPTDRLPIYEEVLSQWFSTGSEPAQPAQPATEDQPDEQPGEQARQDDVPADEPSPSGASGLPKRVVGSTRSQLPKRPDRSERSERTATEQPATQAPVAPRSAPDPDWSSPSDSGWEAAQALLQPVDEMTTAGLPKRRPKAHLVPGSAATTSKAGETTGTAQAMTKPRPELMVPRSAEAVRGRMSSLQQGVARGRHALIEAGAPDGASNSDDDVNSSHQERQ